MNIIGHKKIFLTVSGLLVAASIVAIAVFGFKYGIDFEGGTLWQMKFLDKDISQTQLDEFLKTKLTLEGFIITPGEANSFLMRLPEITEEKHQEHLKAINKELGAVEELSFQTIGSVIGAELRNKAITAFILVLLAISLYIAAAFRKVSRPVSSWKYGFITLITLFHDALIPAGLFAVLGKLYNIEIDTNFIVAILVVMGFSVHDTIVVFDRIRENLKIGGAKQEDFSSIVNRSVNQTIARSINTSLTLVLVLVALFFFGSVSLKFFVLAIGVGVIAGTYSSIFVASPLLTLWRKKN